MVIRNDLLARVFSDAGRFCGKEDVLHAILFHRLLESGLPVSRVVRERVLFGLRADLVVIGPNAPASASPLVVIEVKGGAYGDRNALADTFDASGFCPDMDKLKASAAVGTEAWFIAVDMPELGRALDEARVKRAAALCLERGVAFAYFCQGESRFVVARPGLGVAVCPVAAVRDKAGGPASLDCLFSPANAVTSALGRDLRMVSGHEANVSAGLYHGLRKAGLGVERLSLETYFSFATKPGSRMQDRPDLVVFDPDFNGHFNLYAQGDRRRSNDAHKLAHIQAIFEIKGSESLHKRGEAAILKACTEDLDKLTRWREGAARVDGKVRLDTVFLYVDSPTRPLAAGAVASLRDHGRRLGHGVVVVGREGWSVLCRPRR